MKVFHAYHSRIHRQFETIAEMFKRETGGQVGIVSTAYIADAVSRKDSILP